jgi:GTP-binding protein EngB required for normal cell division
MSAIPSQNKEGVKEKALIKVIVLGCANVGKTSIMERYDSSLHEKLHTEYLDLRLMYLHADLQREDFLD